MNWTVLFDDAFADEVAAFDPQVIEELEACALLLCQFGPQLARPHVDTLKGSVHVNMKELRFNAGNGVWRCAFAFDPDRAAIFLVAGDRAGVSKSVFINS